MILGIISFITIIVGLILGFLAPPDAFQGNLSRILPLHVAGAWLAYLCFGSTFILSLIYLVTRRLNIDRFAAASAEIGVVFMAFALYSGSLWGRPAWGTYWVWDARLTTTALMFVIYIGYLLVRGVIDEPARRARVAAAIGIIASVGIPINYMSVYWWRTQHQTPTFSLVQNQSYLKDNPMLLSSMLVCLAGFTLLFIYLMLLRSNIAKQLEDKKEREIGF